MKADRLVETHLERDATRPRQRVETSTKAVERLREQLREAEAWLALLRRPAEDTARSAAQFRAADPEEVRQEPRPPGTKTLVTGGMVVRRGSVRAAGSSRQLARSRPAHPQGLLTNGSPVGGEGFAANRKKPIFRAP